MVIFPGYDRILGPETLSVGDRLVRTPQDFILWQMATVTVRGGKVWTTKTKVRAYINAGRHVADCAYCHKGMFTRPDWGIACCGECGAFYDRGAVVFDPNHVLAAAVLLRRPDRDTQNWRNPNISRPFQTMAELEQENVQELQC